MQTRILKPVIFVLLLLIPLTSKLSAEVSPDLLDAKTRELFHEALSGEIAKDHVIQITRHHRIQGSRGYRAAAQYVLQQLKSYGFSEKDAYIESFPSDGKATYQTWQSPSGWDITWAELRMIEPEEERIVGYPEIAMSVITYSNPGDVTAELVWVGAGTRDEDYTGKNVKGKIVLATGYGGSVHRLAVLKYGAKAVVCYLDDERAKEYPDMLQYTGMWPRTSELQRVTFGFNITNRQGSRLKSLLESGKKVILRGQVKGTGLEPYFMDVVVAHIRGVETQGEELLYSAHLDHPKESANDNASGSGALLDMARAMKDLIKSGQLKNPKRSFRFLWVPEWYGTMAYVDKHQGLSGPEFRGKFLANINMDMVGENLELLHSRLYITRTPASVPSVLNDVVENMAQMVDRMNVRTARGSQSAMNYRVFPFYGASDHIMFLDRKIPSMMFSHDDYTHHTSSDTPDKVDPVELERCELIATTALWYLANLDAAQALDLSHLAFANTQKQFGDTARRAHQLFAGSSSAIQLAEAENVISHTLQNHSDAVASVLHFHSSDMLRKMVLLQQEQLKAQKEFATSLLQEFAKSKGIASGASPADSDTRVPQRLTRGPIFSDVPKLQLSETDAKWYDSPDFPFGEDQLFELVNFIDGKRNVTQIRNALSAEFKPFAVKDVARYLDDLVKAGVLKWSN